MGVGVGVGRWGGGVGGISNIWFQLRFAVYMIYLLISGNTFNTEHVKCNKYTSVIFVGIVRM